MRTLLRLATLVLAFALCSCAYETIDQHPCPPAGTQLTWENFGSTFMYRYCESCHGLYSPNRMGAPGEFIFDNVGLVRMHKDRIYVRSAASNDSMPPGPDDPAPEERARLAEWRACGAP